MDGITKKEIEKLKSEKKTSSQELDVEKIMFQKKLLGDLGKEISETLENPPKKSLFVGLKYRIKRANTIRKENKEARKILRNIKKGGF